MGRQRLYRTAEELKAAQRAAYLKHKDKNSEKRDNRAAKGLCHCGTPRKEGSTQCERCWRTNRDYNFTYRLELRLAALAAYGNVCACCGESTPEFLQFDHKNNDGYIHRKDNTARAGISLWLKQNGYPDTIQLLCGNCHGAKSFYGYCPHGTLPPQDAASGSTNESSTDK